MATLVIMAGVVERDQLWGISQTLAADTNSYSTCMACIPCELQAPLSEDLKLAATNSRHKQPVVQHLHGM